MNKSSETPYLLRDQFKIDSSKKIIGNIGNHIRAKNLETFVETINQIINIKKRTDLFFIQIGTFTDRTEHLMDKIKELKPKLIFCETKQQNALWVYYRKRTSSIYQISFERKNKIS